MKTAFVEAPLLHWAKRETFSFRLHFSHPGLNTPGFPFADTYAPVRSVLFGVSRNQARVFAEWSRKEKEVTIS